MGVVSFSFCFKTFQENGFVSKLSALKIRVVGHSSDRSINEKQNSCNLVCVIRSEGYRHFGVVFFDALRIIQNMNKINNKQYG